MLFYGYFNTKLIQKLHGMFIIMCIDYILTYPNNRGIPNRFVSFLLDMDGSSFLIDSGVPIFSFDFLLWLKVLGFFFLT